MGVLCLSLFCYALICYLSSFAIILKRTRELVALLLLSHLQTLVTVNVVWLFLTVAWVGLQCMIVVFPDHTHLLYCFENVIIYTYIFIPFSLPYCAFVSLPLRSIGNLRLNSRIKPRMNVRLSIMYVKAAFYYVLLLFTTL